MPPRLPGLMEGLCPPLSRTERKKLFVQWLEKHPDVVENRRQSRLLHGTGTGARREVLDPTNPRIPDSAFRLVLQDEDYSPIFRLHENLAHELEISAEEGEDRCATLWRLGCTGVLHKLMTERVKLETLESLSKVDQQVRQSVRHMHAWSARRRHQGFNLLES